MNIVFQIKSVEIIQPRLRHDLILRVIEELQSIPQLERLTITKPAAFNGLPHHTTLRFLKLTDLPQYCQDWTWLKLNGDLNEIEVSFSTTVEHSEERFVVANERIEVNGMTADGTMKIMEHLPHAMCLQVGYISYLAYIAKFSF